MGVAFHSRQTVFWGEQFPQAKSCVYINFGLYLVFTFQKWLQSGKRQLGKRQFSICTGLVSKMGRQLVLWIQDQTRCCALLNLPLDIFQSMRLWHYEATTGDSSKDEKLKVWARVDSFLLQMGMQSEAQAVWRSCKRQNCFEDSGTAYRQWVKLRLAIENPTVRKGRWQKR